MKRRAIKDDLPFISKLIFDAAKNNHFSRELRSPIRWFFFKRNLNSMVIKDRDNGGFTTEVYIWEKLNLPIGFVILAWDPLGGWELRMAAISSEYRGKGYGREMLDNFLSKFMKDKETLYARCYWESKVMLGYLKRRGFKQLSADKTSTFLTNDYRYTY
ncbi:GNAT family N-acetyltransferase [Serratia sp. Tan611]|uniref:GNAT family N-acetyltransferase n=1 Tax=Serratia sp. Tan611 TaxID=2773264 RepID=UPI0019338EF9|nr:GNAT family N-acetyltransferase [Serratia sp. Tan611]CAE1141657.1 protein of unknown function [Serratia sp. Tan611]